MMPHNFEEADHNFTEIKAVTGRVGHNSKLAKAVNHPNLF